MAHAYTKSEGYVKCSETVSVAAASGADVDTAGSSLAVKGKGMVYAKADESTGVTAVLQYTMDSAAISIGGIGADPNGRALGSQTWVSAKATEGDAATGAMGDDTLEAFLLPKNAEYVRILFTAADGTSAIDEATEIWYDGAVPQAGMSITGIGADPS
tara:strand:+ start:273 stop:746 length:474 start_codon:yes stop_codon:yes gene_type:complete